MKLPGPDHTTTITANHNRVDAIEISPAEIVVLSAAAAL
jgi:hypothetical protein